MPPALRWLIVMPLLLTPPYALSNRLEWLPAYEIPMTAVDHWWIAGPQWTWGYLLLFPLMWAAVACQRDAQRPRSVVLSFALAALIACTLFVLVPTTYPRPGWPAEGAYGAVIGLDTQRNACPSLHGAYSVLSAWWIARAGWSPWLGVAAWALAALVLCSTMAVRQHGVIDLGAGMLLGALIAWLWSRWSRSAAKRQSP